MFGWNYPNIPLRTLAELMFISLMRNQDAFGGCERSAMNIHQVHPFGQMANRHTYTVGFWPKGVHLNDSASDICYRDFYIGMDPLL